MILEKIKMLDQNQGYDARQDEFVDMYLSGIVDPTMVVTSAVEHATAVAISLLSVGCAMVEDELREVPTDSLVDLSEIYS